MASALPFGSRLNEIGPIQTDWPCAHVHKNQKSFSLWQRRGGRSRQWLRLARLNPDRWKRANPRFPNRLRQHTRLALASRVGHQLLDDVLVAMLAQPFLHGPCDVLLLLHIDQLVAVIFRDAELIEQ